jgi:hypothetical protein
VIFRARDSAWHRYWRAYTPGPIYAFNAALPMSPCVMLLSDACVCPLDCDAPDIKAQVLSLGIAQHYTATAGGP